MTTKYLVSFFTAGLAVLFLSSPLPAENTVVPVPSELVFSASDKLLVIAPHPDDEALSSAGAIQSALAAGASVRVVYVTHGESNEISALFYQKKPLVLKSDFLNIGRLRKEEAVAAMGILGLKPESLYFLGYPDSGLMAIWEKHWEGAKPFRSFFTRINKVVHRDDFSYGKYYKGYSLVQDFEKILAEYQPTVILSPSPYDLNLDHQASYLFLKVALLNQVAVNNADPKLYLYLIHSKDWKKDNKYSPSDLLSLPSIKGLHSLKRVSCRLDPEKVRKKEEVIRCYKSQISYSKEFLLSFVRSNEIYVEYSPEKISVNPSMDDQAVIREKVPQEGDVIYRLNESEILVDLPLLYPVDEMGVLTLGIFGYKKDASFSKMPKLKFRLFGNKMFVKDGFKSFYDKKILYKIERDRLILRVSMDALKNPDLFFVTTRTAKDELSLDFGAWKVLKIVDGRQKGQW